MFLSFLSAGDGQRALQAFENLARHDISRWALTGGFATEIHHLRRGRRPLMRSLNDIDFIVDSFATAVADGEMALDVRFPIPGERTAGAYAKMERKVGDFATASSAVQLTLAADGTIASAGIAIGAVGATALRVAEAERLLTGAHPTRELVRAAADEARKLADPSPDTRGSAEFKKDMAGVLTARALEKALTRLGVGGLA